MIGRGASCSQPLLAKRPSCTFGQGLKTTSSPWRAGGGAAGTAPSRSDTVFVASAVPGM